MRRALLLTLALASFAGCNAFCNRRVFEEVKPTCDQTIANDVDIPAEKAADILIVVDNSGSMQEEQDRLAAAFLDESGNCPIGKNDIKDFARCKEESPPAVCAFANPSPEQLAGPLASCGFIQVLAAFENDFRIGIITTDVGLCDNRLPSAQSELFCANNGPGVGTPECAENGVDDRGVPIHWGYHPQRGCLQPNGPPGTPTKVIARADLVDADASNDEIGDRFVDTIKNIRTFGTSIERGLDATKLFLDKNNTDRGPGCENDLGSFLREDAKLVVIYLTDEEDCSRLPDVAPCEGTDCDCPDGNCEIFRCGADQTCTPGVTEFTGESCSEFDEHFDGSRLVSSRCYSKESSLSPVEPYVDFLKSLKGDPNDVSVAVIAGGLPIGPDGTIVGAGCTFNAADGQVALGGCRESLGNSNGADCVASGDCCFADPGDRYYALADQMSGLKDTICVDSFGQTMIKIAVFIADVDKVVLAEKPENPALIFVEKAPAGSEEFLNIGRINDTACGDGNGWVLEQDGVTVRFCGDARPAAGERIRVRAKGEGANGDDADACEGRGSVGG